MKIKSEKRVEVKSGYESLGRVLDEALEQAQSTKGRERHSDGEPFTEQICCSVTRREGHGFARGQAVKKIDEAKRLSPERAKLELLGAINYIAADILVLEEEIAKQNRK